jgi:hypothetical protein
MTLTTDGPGPPSLFPPESFVDALNADAFANGRPLRTALDPLVMLAWHTVSTPPPFRLPLPPL